MLVPPRDEKNQTDAGANGRIGNVERGKSDFLAAALLQIETEKVHDFVVNQTVGEISSDAAEEQAKGDLAGNPVHVEMMAREKQRNERQQHHKNQGAVVVAEQTPRRAGVAPMNEFEKSGDDDFFVAHRQKMQHEPFGELVEREHDERERGDAAIGFLKNGFGSGHDKFTDAD